MTNGGDVLAPGTRLEEFAIERELGAGGFGVTYLAYDHSLGRRVAIKEYLPHDWGTRRTDGGVGPRSSAHAKDYSWGLDRFLEEARVLARLHHPHIVQVYRVIEAWGTAYMVTEYVEGRSLAEALRAEGLWAEARVLGLLDALTVGLAEVHAAGLVHRDIKPANVMLRGDGSPVLIDFGAARQAVGRQSRAVTAVLTPGYAPFEQYSTKGVQGPWTDVYALGAVAYEAVSGRVPEEAPSRMEDDTLPPVAAVAAHGVSAVFASAIGSALALRRQDRPQSLSDWRGLLGLSSAAGTVPAPPGIDHPVPAGASRRWWLAVAAAVVVALAGAGLVWLAGGGGPPETARTAAGGPGGANAGLTARGGGGARGGSEVVAEAAPAERRAAAQGAAERNGADSGLAANESRSVPDDAVPDVAPESVEEALGLDRAGWRRIQEGLAALGLDPGAPDGLVGGGTRRAVRAYQESAGKPATGFLDATDATTLRAAASEADRVAERRRAEAAAEAERRRVEAEAAEAERQRASVAERRRLAELRRPGRVFRDDCDGCPELVVIPAGTFRMGSPASEEGRDDDEGPQHRVTLRSFALGVTEVTFDEWEACVRGGGCNGYRPGNRGWGRGSRPVINVSWNDAQAYVSWLSSATGAGYRLPSESEWEYAARGGTATPFHTGATISTDQANYDGDYVYGSGRRGTYRERTTPAGTFPPNAFGLYDVHGNVWEWVDDCSHGDYSGAPSDGTAWGRGGDCSRRVLRGGSWVSLPRDLRSAARHRYTAGNRSSVIGFRVARTLD